MKLDNFHRCLLVQANMILVCVANVRGCQNRRMISRYKLKECYTEGENDVHNN